MYNISVITSEDDAFSVALCLEGALRAFMAMSIQASFSPGQSLLVINGATVNNFILVQLAAKLGCKVLTTVRNVEEEQQFQNMENGKVTM